jgi:DNA-binding CsgD family transcriptional regulator
MAACLASGLTSAVLLFLRWRRTRQTYLVPLAVLTLCLSISLLANDGAASLGGGFLWSGHQVRLYGSLVYLLAMTAVFAATAEFVFRIVPRELPRWAEAVATTLVAGIPALAFGVLFVLRRAGDGGADLAQTFPSVVFLEHFGFQNLAAAYAMVHFGRMEGRLARALVVVFGVATLLWDPLYLTGALGEGGPGLVMPPDLVGEQLLFVAASVAISLLIGAGFFREPTVTSDSDAVETEDTLALVLSPREREILDLVTEGLVNKEISARLGISENTVKNHLYSTYRKLGVTNRAGAIRIRNTVVRHPSQ